MSDPRQKDFDERHTKPPFYSHRLIKEVYEKGYKAAGDDLKSALSLIPVDIISKNQIIELIDIVRKVSEKA